MKRYQQDEYYNASGIPTLKPILQGWLAAQRDYTTATGDDYVWHYHERACIGFLAAAAWRSGGVALEEWRTDKGPRATPKKGRCDLYIYHPNHYNFHIEAKHIWSPVTGRQATRRVQHKLADAVRAADELHCPRNEKIGVLFVAPFFPAGHQQDMATRIASWLERVCEIQHSAIAWAFRNRETLPHSKKHNVCPGMVVLVRTANDRNA